LQLEPADAATAAHQAIAPVWDAVPVQRCTVYKHRNLTAHALDGLHDEVTADCTDMIYAAIPGRSKQQALAWK
jgi:transposase-like protein